MKIFLNKLLYGGGVVFDLLKWTILAVVVLLILFRFWLSIFIVDGESMEPNLHDKEIVLLKNNAYNSEIPSRGDVVAVRYPGDPEHKKYVKRVVGLPGEVVQLKNGRVHINGEVLSENYLEYSLYTNPQSAIKNNWKLGKEEYFLMGDNRPYSNDSRYFGPVEKRFFDGKAILIVFPRWRLVSNL